MMKKLFLFLLIASFLFGCEMNQKKNDDVHFEYLGYGDSTLSVIYGSVFEDINGTQKPLSDVLIDIIGSNKTTTSDGFGNFSIGTESGQYKIQVSKMGYQSVLLENYQAFSDRVSTVKINLKQGEGVKVVILADKRN
jgi:tRNA threonylcarbamoyladenosine modification (KEOPS) complex  Pcc1 subunit